jgi:HSP20 family protein
MALTVRGPAWDPFSSLVRQLDADFDGIVRRTFGPGARGFVPAADVVRDGSDVVLTLELPGVDVDKDVDVEVQAGKLVISGKRSHSSKSESDGVLVREIRSGSFRREFALPKGVGADAVEADYENGLLRVRVHEVARSEVPASKIAIRQLGAAERTEPESD